MPELGGDDENVQFFWSSSKMSSYNFVQIFLSSTKMSSFFFVQFKNIHFFLIYRIAYIGANLIANSGANLGAN